MLYSFFKTDVDLLPRDIHENDIKKYVEKSDRLDRAVIMSVDKNSTKNMGNRSQTFEVMLYNWLVCKELQD